MAPLSNYISFLFLTTLLLPPQIIASDSQFFSKLTHFNNKETEAEVVPKKELPVTNMPQEQQPAFITETKNSYGLYGHDSETENNNKYYNNDAYNTKYHNNDVFVNNQNELSDTKYTEEGYNSMENHNNNNNNNNYFNNNDANERYYHNNKNNYNDVANNDMYHVEKQGMSDTRFLEGGKYFYDLNYENNNPTLYDDSSRGYNNRRYNNAYQNHGNYNVHQNQEEFEDEQNEFEP